jgi:hypothetical protein
LNEKRGDKVAEVFFVLVPKVKVEKPQGGLPGIAQQQNVFDDGRALVVMSFGRWPQ